MGNSVRCDLAVEAKEMYVENEKKEGEIPGIEVEEESVEGYINITRVKVVDERGVESIGKEIGNYITIEMPARFYGQQEIYEQMCQTCAKELKTLTDNFLSGEDDCILVVGLGNWNITADALGPKVMEGLMITRHLKEYVPEEIDEGVRPVCGVAPGVLGITGVETGEIVKGLADRIKPKLIIAIDALCSRKIERINTTIQLTDTGITPGAGVGNKRKAINQETLGVPVIAIGVPTVVDAATIASDTINLLVEELDERQPLYTLLKNIEQRDKYTIIQNVISPHFGNFIVAPKEVDTIIDDISSVIANGINMSVHDGITLKDVDKYV